MLVKTWGRGDIRIRVTYPERVVGSKAWFMNIIEFRYEQEHRVGEWMKRWDDARKWVEEQTKQGLNVNDYINELPLYGLRWIAAHEYVHIAIHPTKATPMSKWKHYFDKQEVPLASRLPLPEYSFSNFNWKLTLFGHW